MWRDFRWLGPAVLRVAPPAVGWRDRLAWDGRMTKSSLRISDRFTLEISMLEDGIMARAAAGGGAGPYHSNDADDY